VAQALILDAEAIHALARAAERPVLAARARAILQVAREEQALVHVPAPVLAEVCRGGRFDAAIDRLLSGRGISVLPLTETDARRAGALLTRARLGSEHAVDAFVVASGLGQGRAIIATGDPDDISRLSAGFRQIRVFAV
jgi:predicted nucleic acid-binding protein